MITLARGGFAKLTTIIASKQITTKASRKWFILVVAAMALISRCAAQGAKRVPRDRFDYNAAIAQSTREQMLMNSVRNRFRITDRVTHLKEDEISIQTRSVMAMMEFMARGVDVPLEHLEDGRVIDYGLQNSDGEVAKGLIPFRMRSGKNRPENAYAAVKYQGYWYYIAHNDITSKRALSLIIVLFRLQAPTPAGAAPILSLPTG